MSRQALVLDANILVRVVLGQRVFKLLNQYWVHLNKCDVKL